MNGILRRALPIAFGKEERDGRRDAESGAYLVIHRDIEEVNYVVDLASCNGSLFLFVSPDEVAMRVQVSIVDRNLKPARAQPRFSGTAAALIHSADRERVNHLRALASVYAALSLSVVAQEENADKRRESSKEEPC